MNNLKWSIFSRWYRGKNSDCVYNSLDASYVLFPERIERFEPGDDYFPRGLDPKTIDTLISKNILCEKSQNEEDTFASLSHNKCNISNLNVLVTEKCNLMCSYCQITQNTESTKSMTVSIAKKVLDHFFLVSDKNSNLTINITGGEPLLNWRTVKYIIEYCKPYRSRCRVVMFTNAMLMTSEIAKYLSENNVFVIISFDGPKIVHDRNRKNGNKGSYDQALVGYNLAKQAGCKCAISAVANEYSLSNTSAFSNWVVSMAPDSLGFNYPHLLLNSDRDCFDFSQYTKAVIYLHDEMQNNNIYFENFERFKKVFLERKIRLSECQACGKGITVRPDGMVGPCKSLLVSDLECYLLDEYNFDTNNFLVKWAKRKTINDIKCRKCRALSICGGGCAYDSFIINNGDISKMDYRMCDYIKTIFNQIMEDLCDNKIAGYIEEIQSVGH